MSAEEEEEGRENCAHEVAGGHRLSTREIKDDFLGIHQLFRTSHLRNKSVEGELISEVSHVSHGKKQQ